MIIQRYILRNIVLGTLLALAVLVSLSLFFIFIGELEHIGKGLYGLLQVVEFIALRVPGKIVEVMPLAILLGTILSLGSLAANSEIIAMQAAGVSLRQLLRAVIQAALLLAFISFLLSDFVVPTSETHSRNIRTAAIDARPTLRSKTGLWIKDENQVLHIRELLPNGIARGVEIYQLDAQGKLYSTIKAGSAIPVGERWHLKQVQQSTFDADGVSVKRFADMVYRGNISHQLLNALMIEPRQMSSTDLYAYRSFLRENSLDDRVESLTFWKKMFEPLTVLVMCLLAVPFVLGSQRQGNTGHRLMMGILLGLAYVVSDKLLTQLGGQLQLNPVLNALSPALVFFILALYLLARKQTHGLKIKPAAA